MTSLRTPADLGAAIRAERLRRGLSQADLAEQAGTTREWIGRLESGAPRVELDKALRAAEIVGISLTGGPVIALTELATDEDRALADVVMGEMDLEGQHLSEQAQHQLLAEIVRERLMTPGATTSAA